jgi:hypothetical protein
MIFSISCEIKKINKNQKSKIKNQKSKIKNQKSKIKKKSLYNHFTDKIGLFFLIIIYKYCLMNLILKLIKIIFI